MNSQSSVIGIRLISAAVLSFLISGCEKNTDPVRVSIALKETAEFYSDAKPDYYGATCKKWRSMPLKLKIRHRRLKKYCSVLP